MSINPPAIPSLTHARQWGSPRWALLGWYVGSLIIWGGGLVALASQGFIQPRAVPVGMLLWPLFMLTCALPVTWIVERQVEERHQREMADLERHRQETNLKLLVLQAQIEPHFLFNTLASLRALLREDVRQAEAAIDALVQHLRAVLPIVRTETGDSSLSDQLAICSSYLQLMTIRLENRLTFRFEIPGSLLAASVPPLMLLTLVENAVKHGIEPFPGPGYVTIEAERLSRPAGAFMEVRVIDTGAGLSTGPGGGLGLKNIREQLALRYGEQATLSLCSLPAGGTIASIVLPLSGRHPP